MAQTALAISIIALVVALMALPTAAQMIWGKPKLTIRFSSKDLENGRIMVCQLFNYPIVRGFKKKIGVRRMPIEDMMASFSIDEYATNRVVHTGSVPYILRYDGVTDAQRSNLAASAFPAHFGVVSVDYNTKTAKVFEENTTLPVGKYNVKVSVMFQENTVNGEGILIINNNEYPYAYWK